MALDKLDHYSIRTTRLDETRRFYTDVLGLEVGPRPEFPFPGVWLYHGSTAVVHVIGIDKDDPGGLADYMGAHKPMTDFDSTGSLDHIAFTASDRDGLRQRFTDAGAKFFERKVPNMDLHQMFLEDPNGVTIELNFR